MVQPNGNQHPVGETVDERAERAGTPDEPAQPGQTGVEERVEVAHRERDHQTGQRYDDRDEPAAAEESEIRRKFDGVVAVEQPGGQQAHHDAPEHAVVDLRRIAGRASLAGEHDRRHGLEDRIHHQVTDHSRERGGTVGLAGEADRHTDGEQQRQVGEQRTTGLAHRLEERSDHRGVDPTQQVILAQSEQDAGRREYRDRQHQALAQPLQLGEAGDFQTRFRLCACYIRRFAHL